jgi:hypothetical protein
MHVVYDGGAMMAELTARLIFLRFCCPAAAGEPLGKNVLIARPHDGKGCGLNPFPWRFEMSLTRRPSMTAKRIAANRANAKLSRGPSTIEGKVRSVVASVRHGFYAHGQSEVLLALGEDPLQFQELLDSLIETWQPQDFQEMTLVMRLARAYWRMGRADRIQESLLVEQVHRPLPLPTPLDIINDHMLVLANRVSIPAARVCKQGYFTVPEDFQAYRKLYGKHPEEGDEEGPAILLPMRRLRKPGAAAGDSWIDAGGGGGSALPEEGGLREEERQKLRLKFFTSFARIHSKATLEHGEPRRESKRFHTRHGFESLMAPQDGNG